MTCSPHFFLSNLMAHINQTICIFNGYFLSFVEITNNTFYLYIFFMETKQTAKYIAFVIMRNNFQNILITCLVPMICFLVTTYLLDRYIEQLPGDECSVSVCAER